MCNPVSIIYTSVRCEISSLLVVCKSCIFYFICDLICMLDFIEVPSPPIVAVTLDETYVYRCNHSETESIFWIINNTRLNEIIPPPPLMSSNIIPLPGGGIMSTLTIGGILQNNGTIIQCLAISQDQSSTAKTANATFLIQGDLSDKYFQV